MSHREGGVTSAAARLCQPLDVQSFADVVLDGAPVAPHHAADGLSQDPQVVEDLQGCAHLGGILLEGDKRLSSGEPAEGRPQELQKEPR